MHLTIINQFYPPDFAPTGTLAASVAEHRAEGGDQVTVVASRGGYVRGSPADGSRHTHNLRILRIWTPRLGKKTLLARMLDYGAFYLQATFRMALLKRQDVVIVLTTPPLIGLVGALHKRLHPGTSLVLWNMDSYPEVPERAGAIRPGGIVSRALRRLTGWLIATADHVVCLDSAMENQMKIQHGTDLATSVIHNWEKAEDFPPNPPVSPELGTSGLPPANRFVTLYVGNAGVGHRFDTVLEAAEQLRDELVSFLFVGGGQSWQGLSEAKRAMKLENLHLLDYLPQHEVRAILASADCGLVTLRDSFLGLISPSKIHAYLAIGLPLIYVGPEGGNVDEAIRRFDCGVSLRHGDVEGLVGFVRGLMSDPTTHQSFRQRARAAFDTAYTDSAALPKFDRLLDQLASGQLGTLNDEYC